MKPEHEELFEDLALIGQIIVTIVFIPVIIPVCIICYPVKIVRDCKNRKNKKEKAKRVERVERVERAERAGTVASLKKYQEAERFRIKEEAEATQHLQESRWRKIEEKKQQHNAKYFPIIT